MIVSSIEQAKKRESRVNVFLDGNFWLGLDKNELLHFGLHKGKEISNQEKKEIEKSSEFTKLLEKAINYTFVRPRSIQEMRTYLKLKRGVSEEETEKIVNILRDRNYLDDKKFAKWFVENRLSFGTHGENKIRAELTQKGVSEAIIKESLSEALSEKVKQGQKEKIREYISKNASNIKASDKFERKQKLIQRLLVRGFKYPDINSVLKEGQ